MKFHLWGRSLSLKPPKVMGALNLTPDSFSDGGLYVRPEDALRRAREMSEEGAAILDLGAESTRPGAHLIEAEEELDRLLPVLEPLLKDPSLLISVDTSKPKVAEEVLARGVPLINDVRGLRDPALREVIGGFGASAVIMHMQGEPQTMQRSPRYDDVVEEVKAYLDGQARLADKAGIRNLILDPGIGFGKTVEHNLSLLRHLSSLRTLGYPLCLGVSRKSFIGKITGIESPLDRLEGTIVSNALGLWQGADLLRVHEVRAAVRTVQMVEAIRGSWREGPK